MANTIGCVFVDPLQPKHRLETQTISACRQLAGRPLIDWVVRRVSEALQIDELVVITDSKTKDHICDSVPTNVSIFESEHPDRLGRLSNAVTELEAEGVVCIPVNSPFIDPSLLDRLISTANVSNCDYASYRSTIDASVIHSQLGLVADWCRGSVVRKLQLGLIDQRARNLFTQYVVGRPEEFTLKLLPLPLEIDRKDLKLTLDNTTDWSFAEQIVEALGDDGLNWKQISVLLNKTVEGSY